MAITNKIRRLFKIINVEIYIYVVTDAVFNYDSSAPLAIQKKIENKKISYWMYDDNTIVHKSLLYSNVHVLKLINKTGLVIGSCYTNPDYRGQSIYPKVISHIAKDNRKTGNLFINVDTDNISSIRGIEEAGYKRLAYIKTKKWLFFYFNKAIEMYG